MLYHDLAYLHLPLIMAREQLQSILHFKTWKIWTRAWISTRTLDPSTLRPKRCKLSFSISGLKRVRSADLVNCKAATLGLDARNAIGILVPK